MTPDPAYTERLAELALYARASWAVAIICAILLVALAVRVGRRFSVRSAGGQNTRSPFRLLIAMHNSDSAIASMEFLMVLFPFLVIVMTVWQFAFMFNAQLHVGYSAYAAARSASVMIHAELEDEKEGELKKQNNSKDNKWRRIRRAAIPGTIAISPGNPATALKVIGAVALGGVIPGGKSQVLPSNPGVKGTATQAAAQLALGAHYGADAYEGTRKKRFLTKAAYAAAATRVLINGQDEKQNLTALVKDADLVTVTVDYVFWLQVPFVGRMLEALFEGWKNPVTGRPITNPNPYPSMTISETVVMKSWKRQRAIEPKCS